jgi:hypothetical protein
VHISATRSMASSLPTSGAWVASRDLDWREKGTKESASWRHGTAVYAAPPPEVAVAALTPKMHASSRMVCRYINVIVRYGEG